MSAAPTSPCPLCGEGNPDPNRKGRCRACGGNLSGKTTLPAESVDRQRHPGFSVLWTGISLAVVGIVTAAVLVGLPMVVPAFDFEGSAGMLLAIPVWFFSGMLMGLISPERTLLEPLVATLIVAIPTGLHLYTGQTVKTMPAFLYVIMSALGVLFAMIGAHFGERIQVGPNTARAPE